MTQRNFVVIFGMSALALAWPLAGCGDFGSDPAGSGTGGSGSGTGGTGGSDAETGGSDAGTGGSDAETGGSDAGTGGSDADGTGGVVHETPPDASCDDVEACGGEVMGAWFAVDSCLTVSGKANLTAHGIGCIEADADGTLEVTGNWTIADDGTLTDTTQTTGVVHLVLGPECKDVSHTVTQCDALAGPLLASLGFVREGSDCVDSEVIEGGCDCTGIVNQAGSAVFLSTNIAPTGYYETEGNTLTFTGYETIDYDYCVDGNFMHLTPATVNDIGTVTGTVVFQKQP